METCPFCGDEMRRGFLRVRGINMWDVAVTFEADDGTGEGEHLLSPGWLGRKKRSATCCVGCKAVVVDPEVAA